MSVSQSQVSGESGVSCAAPKAAPVMAIAAMSGKRVFRGFMTGLIAAWLPRRIFHGSGGGNSAIDQGRVNPVPDLIRRIFLGRRLIVLAAGFAADISGE